MNSLECSRIQAESMAKFSGILLNEEQIIAYMTERVKMPTGNKEKEGLRPWRLSDQELLNSLIDQEQSIIFREKYPNIFS